MIWTCVGFEGHYPVGTSAVVSADTIKEAEAILRAELAKAGLDPNQPLELVGFAPYGAHAKILSDGNY